MNRIAFTIALLLACLSGMAQNDMYQSGARSIALSNATITFRDHWGSFNNQAAISYVKNVSLGLYAENRFGLKELNSGALALVIPLKNKTAIGLSFFTFNNSIIYSKQKYGLALSKAFNENFSIGLQFDFLRTHLEEYGNNLSFCGEIGFLYRISGKWDIGIHIFNPTATKYTKYEEEKIPTIMRIGTGYKLGDNTLAVLELENSSAYNLVVKGGLEYELGSKLAFEIGARSKPFVNSFGIAFKGKNFRINVALQYHHVLSATPGISFDQVFFNK